MALFDDSLFDDSSSSSSSSSSGTVTVLQIIKAALRAARSLGVGRNIGDSAKSDCLFTFNLMLEAWAIERLIIFQLLESQYTWPGATATRSIGPTGNFEAARPVRIESARIVTADGNRYDVEVVTEDKWRQISQRSQQGTIPRTLYCDAAYPNAALKLHPVPSDAVTLEMTTWAPVTTFTNVDDPVSFPPGYARALINNLAIELAPQFPDSELTQTVLDMARESKAWVKALNAPSLEMECDPALVGSGGRFDITTG